MRKILAIGNSFSEDAAAYLHDIAQQDGVETQVVNLYIGGCSLQQHDENITHDARVYRYDLNGSATDRPVSVKEALTEDDWDIVTLQQASHDSGLERTYYPYIINLSAYIKKYAPAASQMIHETWAYEINSSHEAFQRYDKNQDQMYRSLKAAYEKAADTLNLAIIPCGEVIQNLRRLPEFDVAAGGRSLCRDGYHMHMIYGRYAAAATWYETIFKKNIMKNTYLPPQNDPANDDEHLFCIIKQTVHDTCTKQRAIRR
ncbi:MAG: DUF4886 domain-containing protein [Clostridiaceae bacterium]|nr:DUF4886 domain-containing protein [Clostridiaceae bacterium]